MRMLVFIAVLIANCLAARAQQAPHDFAQDTPPVPGQIVETPRDRLRLAPATRRWYAPAELGLPSNGPKGLLRESLNERRYAPRSDR